MEGNEKDNQKSLPAPKFASRQYFRQYAERWKETQHEYSKGFDLADWKNENRRWYISHVRVLSLYSINHH